MAKKILTLIKLQIPGGQANPAPPVGPALGQHGVNIMEFCKAFNAQTAQENGRITPVEITGFEDAKFDETVEAHFRLGLNVRHADQQLRGTIMLPHGIGKEVRVAVFAEGEKAREAEVAGADIVGSADLASRIEEGFLDFDVSIA